MAYNQQISDGESGAGGVTKINDYWQRVRYPEDYGAVGDGVADDDTPIGEWVTQLNGGSNKARGSSIFTTYLISTIKQFTRNVIIDFPGTIKRTTASTISTILQFSFGSAGFTSVAINVDGNSLNANTVTGILIDSGSNNTKSRHRLGAQSCTTGVKITGNVEKLVAACDIRSNVVGVNINNDGSANTPDEIYLELAGADNDTFLLSDGTEKTSYIANFQGCEQADDNTKYAIDHQNGVGTIMGGIRGVHGGVMVTTNSALQFKFDNFRLYGKGAGSDLRPILVDAANCLISGQTDLYEWEEGIWIKLCANGSNLKVGKRDTGSVGTGLRIGDFANTKLTSFNFEGTLFGSVYNLHLDYARGSYINILNTIDAGTILISANSDNNTILIPKSSSTKLITNNRTELDNTIIYKGCFTNAELELINGGTFIKGMVVEASADTSVYGRLFWNGSNWKSENGLTYNTGTNTWS